MPRVAQTTRNPSRSRYALTSGGDVRPRPRRAGSCRPSSRHRGAAPDEDRPAPSRSAARTTSTRHAAAAARAARARRPPRHTTVRAVIAIRIVSPCARRSKSPARPDADEHAALDLAAPTRPNARTTIAAPDPPLTASATKPGPDLRDSRRRGRSSRYRVAGRERDGDVAAVERAEDDGGTGRSTGRSRARRRDRRQAPAARPQGPRTRSRRRSRVLTDASSQAAVSERVRERKPYVKVRGTAGSG